MRTGGDHPAVLATRSAGKLRELRPLFEGEGFRVETLEEAGIRPAAGEDGLEVYETFEANAIAKAEWFAARLPGRLVFADDSGLEIDALGGAPGVRSKRWSGRDDLDGAALDAVNNALLLERLREALPARETDDPGNGSRRARYVCAAACIWPGGRLVARGTTEGVILDQPRGGGGFGYDPYFLSADLGITFAESERDLKATVSHRGRAFRALLAQLKTHADDLVVPG